MLFTGNCNDEAIQLSRTYYNDEEQTNRVLIILSDGEDHNNLSKDVAEAAAEEGIKIYTIGVGTEKGGPIPIKRNGVVIKYKKDSDENVVITKLNSQTLKEISSIGNGVYVNGKNTAEVTEEITSILSNLDKKNLKLKNFLNTKINFNGFWVLLFSF